ncbi:hypothetical protein [Nostoc sp.]
MHAISQIYESDRTHSSEDRINTTIFTTSPSTRYSGSRLREVHP